MTESLDVHPHPHEHANPVAGHGNPLTRKIGPLPVYAWAGIIIVIALAYRWYSNRQAANTAAASTSSGAANTSGDASGVGGVTGAGSGFSGSSTGGSGTVVTGPQGATTNSQWASLVLQAFVAAGADPTTVSNALTDYLNGNSLTAAEQAIVNQALTQFGPPPQGVLPVSTVPITPPVTTPTVADGYYRDPITTAIYEVYNGQIWHLDPTEWHSVPSSAQHYTTIDSTWAGYKLPQGSGIPPGTSDTASVTQTPPASKPTAPPPSAPKPAPPKATTRTYTVKSGDSLFSIAQHFYGNGNDWGKIYDANKSKIGSNPNLIHVGTVLTIP